MSTLISLPFKLLKTKTKRCRFFLCEIATVQSFFNGCAETCLTPGELAIWQGIRDTTYKNGWLSGRLLVKSLCEMARRETFFNDANEISGVEIPVIKAAQLRQYELGSRNEMGKGIRPLLNFEGNRHPATVTISHSDAVVCVGVDFSGTTTPGVDVTPIGAVSPVVVNTFFDKEEQALVLAEPNNHWPERLWCAKEAAYKALNRGEPFAPSRFQLFARSDDQLEYLCHWNERPTHIQIVTDVQEKSVCGRCVLERSPE